VLKCSSLTRAAREPRSGRRGSDGGHLPATSGRYRRRNAIFRRQLPVLLAGYPGRGTTASPAWTLTRRRSEGLVKRRIRRPLAVPGSFGQIRPRRFGRRPMQSAGARAVPARRSTCRKQRQHNKLGVLGFAAGHVSACAQITPPFRPPRQSSAHADPRESTRRCSVSPVCTHRRGRKGRQHDEHAEGDHEQKTSPSFPPGALAGRHIGMIWRDAAGNVCGMPPLTAFDSSDPR